MTTRRSPACTRQPGTSSAPASKPPAGSGPGRRSTPRTSPAGCPTPCLPPLVRAHQPEILITQHGCDSHRADPLAHLMLTVDGQRASYLALHDLAHEVCGGRWVATGGGGYAVVEVVPRSWSHLLAIVGGE